MFKDALELEDNVIAALESIFELPDNEEIGQKDKDIREIERIENDSEVTSSVEIDDENLEI